MTKLFKALASLLLFAMPANAQRVISADAIVVPASSWTFTFPLNPGTANYVLATDGSGNTSWVVGGGSGGISALTGDVSASGTGSVAATVNSVGGSSAASVHSAELAANGATSADTPSTLVSRDSSGNFSAGNITAALTGHASADEPAITAGSTSQYWRGDKSFQTLDTSVVPENSNLYYTQGRFDSAFAAKSTSNLSEGSNLYFTNARARAAISALSPVLYSNSTGVVSEQQANTSQAGYLSASDWNTFNNKLDQSRFNYITNPDAELNTSGWNLYNDTGRTVPAFVVDQDITYTSALSGGAGNGATVSYTLCGVSYVGPVVTCPTSTSVQVCWYNGPTLAQNPTATVLKAAYDAQSCATAIATSAITGTASKLQYQTGTSTLGGGGDTSPVDGTGGVVTGVTFTRNTSTPLVGTASFDLGKDASSREGMGVSTDFIINSLDKGQPLQISFAYQGSTGMVLGGASDVQVFLYDITNAIFIPVTPLQTIPGPINTAKTYVGQFTADNTSVDYRLILHIATANASAWDLLLDNVIVNDVLNATAATQVPSVVLQAQSISGAVTDHMAVAWVDGASQWVPATSAYNGDYWSMLGFATNIVGATADIYVHGYMDGFSFGPFSGYNQYIDPSLAGGLTPLPSPFTDTYVIMGKAISATAMNIQVFKGIDLVQTSGVPRKGGILTNTGANDGTGDVAIAGGTTGQFLMANSAITNGLAWNTPVGTAPIVYTAGTHAWSCAVSTNSVAGCLSAADHTTFASAVTTMAAIGATPNANGASISAATLTLQPANASFGGVVTAGTQTFAGAKTLATPTFTGDANASTGNLLVSTIGKGLQVKTGTNAKIGTAVLSGGTVTVANTSVTANSRIFVTSNTDGGTPGWLRVSAKTVSTSFVITSSSVLDTSTVAWEIRESIP